MIQFLKRRLWFEEEGQDLTEYALLLFFLCLTSVMAMRSFASSVTSVYAQASSRVIAARFDPSASSASEGISARSTPVHTDSFHEKASEDILTNPAPVNSQKR